MTGFDGQATTVSGDRQAPGAAEPARVTDDGDAEIDRLPFVAGALRRVAARYGTPAYITDVASIDARAGELAAAFPDPWIRQYSVKANDVPAIVARIERHGLGANVVSRGEWELVRRGGMPNARIALEGIGKSDADLAAAVAAVVHGDPPLWVSVESIEEAERLGRLTEEAALGDSGRRVDAILRLNPDVAPETHPGLAVGRGGSKFGLAEHEVVAAIEAGGGFGGPLRWRGLHVHVGSQLGAVDAWRDAVRRGLALLALLRGTSDAFDTLDTLDVGGGFPVGPLGTPLPGPARFARELPALLAAIPAERRPGRLAIEPGRFLVARAGWLVARVLHVRDRGRPLVVIDAGMTELLRPALYGAYHPIVALTSGGLPLDAAAESAASEGEMTRVDGPICESTDALGEHRLPPLRRGDLVAIRDVGAYGATQSSAYNGRPRPPQILLEPDGRLVVARRRGTLASLA